MEKSIVQEEKQESQIPIPTPTQHVFKRKSVILIIGILLLLILIIMSVVVLKQNFYTHSLSQVQIVKPKGKNVPSPQYLLNGTQPSNTVSQQPTLAPILPSTVMISGVTPSLSRNDIIQNLTLKDNSALSLHVRLHLASMQHLLLQLIMLIKFKK
jgi:capsular polysaccharide biosynthesis protein